MRPLSLILGTLVVAATAVTGAGVLAWSSSSEVSAAPPGAPLPRRYAGVNLASGSFGKVPGIHGRDYIYPSASDAAPFRAAGMTTVRLPFRWERLQPIPGQPLDQTELARIDQLVRAMAPFPLIILDAHNYGAHQHIRLGSPALPSTALSDLWRRLADHYRSNPKVAFGIMNEPIKIDPTAWRIMAEDAVGAIRATGARNLVLVPGVRWTGAHSWNRGSPSNAEAMAGFRDPAANMAFELHQYVDGNSSGTGTDCVAPAVAAARMADATTWLRAQHARGFLGEFGAPGTPDCVKSLDALLAVMDRNHDVWLGWTYWAGGSRWNNYPLSIQPDQAGPKPQMAVLERYIRAMKQ